MCCSEILVFELKAVNWLGSDIWSIASVWGKEKRVLMIIWIAREADYGGAG